MRIRLTRITRDGKSRVFYAATFPALFARVALRIKWNKSVKFSLWTWKREKKEIRRDAKRGLVSGIVCSATTPLSRESTLTGERTAGEIARIGDSRAPRR